MLTRYVFIAVLLAAGSAFPQTKLAPWPSTPEQEAHRIQLRTWAKQCLDYCGAEESCKDVCYRAYGNSVACAAGHHPACDERTRDLADIERINAQKRKPVPQAPTQDTLMRCMQETATATVKACKETSCDATLLMDIIGETQRIRCGYSAIRPVQPVQPPSASQSAPQCTPQTVQYPTGRMLICTTCCADGICHTTCE